MERQVLYPAVSSSSIDSWDFENLKYLRKLSTEVQQQQQIDINQEFGIRNTHEEIGSEEQFLHYDEAEQSQVYKIINDAKIESSSSSSSDEGISQGQRTGSDEDDIGKFSTLTTGTGLLDNCYLLDVVTIRNESVLANRISPNLKVRLGSDGYETASSAASSVEERSFFHADTEVKGNCSISPSSDSMVSEPKISVTKNPRRVTSNSSSCNACPYCGDRKRSSGTYSRPSVVGGYGVDPISDLADDYGSISLVPTLGGEIPEEVSRANSPYYVRLRRDLHLSTCASPQLRPPANFGVDQQGQLLIDYSPNWEGLEKYIRALKMCN